MRLRYRSEIPTDNSSTVAATVPVLPPDIARLRTPPISELSNAGSTIARKERLSDLSSSPVDVTDMEETMDSMSPKERRRPKIMIPAAPLTQNNLEKHQEEITSAVEVAPEDARTLQPVAPNARIVQARNFLLAENGNTYPGFATRLEQIDDFLCEIPKEMREMHPSICHEVEGLLRRHRTQVTTVEETPTRRPLRVVAKVALRPTISRPAEHRDADDDDEDSEDQDPFERTNIVADLTERASLSPSGGKNPFAPNPRELARPVNDGRPPSTEEEEEEEEEEEAYRLINAQMIKENAQNESSKKNIDRERLWTFEKYVGPGKKESKLSLERWSGDRTNGEEERAIELQLGQGALMPKEVLDFDWGRDRRLLGEDESGDDNSDAQFLVAETPSLQALMGEQIRSDLADGALFCWSISGDDC